MSSVRRPRCHLAHRRSGLINGMLISRATSSSWLVVAPRRSVEKDWNLSGKECWDLLVMSAMSPREETRAWMLTPLQEGIPVFPSLSGKWDERKVQLKKRNL